MGCTTTPQGTWGAHLSRSRNACTREGTFAALQWSKVHVAPFGRYPRRRNIQGVIMNRSGNLAARRASRSFGPLMVLVAGLALGLAPVSLAQSAKVDVEASALAKGGDNLPIRRITLYRSGVGSFDRRGMVQGNANIQLRFTTDQINDILKSMVVLDMSKGKGTIDGISYGSKEPLAKRLASFGVNIADNPSAGEILQRLRGTQVKLSMTEGDVTGTVMNVETRPTVYQGSGDKGTVVHNLPWINLLTSKGVRSYNLATSNGFEILDPALAAELNKALEALAEYRADRTKTVDIKLSGEGARNIVVAYVQEMPVWKTSYRLVLPDAKPGEEKATKADGKSKPSDSFTIQGWAIVENTTDEDWNDVTLSLVSGRPVSFTMDLYEPLFLTRPDVPVPTIPGVFPRTYAGGVERPTEAGAEMQRSMRMAPGSPRGTAGGRDLSMAKSGAPPAASPMADASLSAYRVEGISAEDMAGYGAASQARAVEAGEVFQFELENPVTVERQRSAMLPILSSGIEGRRVSIYSYGEAGEHPMRGLELTNSTNLQLMPGPISVFDGGTYAGDAQIGHVPAGDKRLVAYAVDLDVAAQRTDNYMETVQKVRWVKGLLEMTTLRQQKVSYAFNNKDQKRARTVIIEQAKMEGWDLADTIKPSESTNLLYRFELDLDAGKEGKVAITQQRTDGQMVMFANISGNQMIEYSKNGKVSKAVMDAFRDAQRRQGLIQQTQAEIARVEESRRLIDADQARIRQNMDRLDRTTELYKKYLATLTEQEGKLEQSAAQLTELRERMGQQERDLADYLAGLNLD